MNRRNGKYLNHVVTSVFVIGLIAGCAKERPVKPILANSNRVAKKSFEGDNLFLKSVSGVRYPGEKFGWIAPGMYMVQDQLVKFVIQEKTLDIVAIRTLIQDERPAEKNQILASFPVRHVDVLRKQNVDGQDTHEEEETESRRPWNQRDFVVIDTGADAQDPFLKEAVSTTPPNGIEIDPNSNSINFDVKRQLKDETIVSLRYSFKRQQKDSGYKAKEYPRSEFNRIGFFRTTVDNFDQYGRVTQSNRKTYVNRWDTSKKVVYYLSKDFPKHLKPAVLNVFQNWNESFKSATGHDVLEVRDNSGQELGDLRYNMITYDDSPNSGHGILGYGPSFTDPSTGEILKADVILYGGVLKRSKFNERLWEIEIAASKQPSPAGGGSRPSSPKSEIGLAGLTLPFSAQRFADTSRINTGSGIDRSLVQGLKTEFEPNKAIAALQAEMRKTQSHLSTFLNEEVLNVVGEARANEKLSDEDLEVKIFIPLLTHELGHNLGLRHNFMGSADSRHYAQKSKSSSVMDYGFLTSEEPPVPGPYDKTAIQYGYGADGDVTKKLLADNYFFCTDEHVFDPRNMMCNQFDSGNSLQEIMKQQLARYRASYLFNNLRLDSVHFDSISQKSYVSRVLRHIIPFRLTYDSSQAILDAVKANSIGDLWYLTRQRIEADSKSDPKNLVTLKVSEGTDFELLADKVKQSTRIIEKKIDLAKIKAVIDDATRAKTLAFSGLLAVLTQDDRPNYSSGDVEHGDLQVRGILPDKILSLLFLTMKTRHPMGNGTAMETYTTMNNGMMPMLLASILSNTLPAEDETTGAVINEIFPFDENLREMALDLLVNDLAVPGSTASARDLITSEYASINLSSVAKRADLVKVVQLAEQMKPLMDKLKEDATKNIALGLISENLLPNLTGSLTATIRNLKDYVTLGKLEQLTADFEKARADLKSVESSFSADDRAYTVIQSYREQIQRIRAAIMLGEIKPEDQEKAVAEMIALEMKRGAINVAYTQTLGDKHVKAPVLIRGIESATGHLLRDNMNRVEDIGGANALAANSIQAKIRAELAKPEDQRNMKLIQAGLSALQTLSSRSVMFQQYLANERLFAERLVKLYELK